MSLQPSRIGLPRPTAMAWGLLVLCMALLGAAINTGNNLLYLLFGLFAATLPVSLSLSLLNLLRLRASIDAPDTIQAGIPYTVTVHLRNRGRRAARAVRVRLFTHRGVLGPALVERIPGRGMVKVTLTGCETMRGPLRIMGVRLGAVVPLGLMERRRFYPAPATPLVLPAAPACALPIRGGLQAHGQVPVPVGAAGSENDGLRRGSVEDDVRHIDWKSTARRGVLLVRETAGESRPLLKFDLCTQRSGDPHLARIAFEGEISYHAGRARRTLEGGGQVRMTVDGADRRTFSGTAGLPPLLRRLALLEPTGSDGRLLPAPAVDSVPAPVTPSPLPPTPPGDAMSRSALLALGVAATALYAYQGLGTAGFLVLLTGLLVILARGGDRRPHGPWGRRLWPAAGVLALLVFIADLVFLRHNPLDASLNLIAFIALFKMFNSQDARDDRQIILVSLLMIVLAAALTTAVSFVVPLLAWLAMVTHAQMAWSHLPLDRGRFCRPARYTASSGRLLYAAPTAVAVLGLVVVGALLFLAIPHLGTGTFSPGILRPGASSGFSETTRLGDIGRIKLDRSRVMQVRLSGRQAGGQDLRWRGMALDHFDGSTWTRTATGLDWFSAGAEGWFHPRGEPEAPRRGEAGLLQEIRLDPSPQRVLFAAASPARLRSEDFLFLAEDGTGALILPGRPGRGLTYTVASILPERTPSVLRAARGPDPPRVRSLHLGLPPLDRRVAGLARRLTGDQPTRYDAARALESWLSGGLEYSLDVADAGHADPLAAFLFEGMPGHCEYFATSMVVLARAAGIPARFVTGYLRGERSRFAAHYTVRQSDAHAWVEVFFPGVGWVPFDPTPAAGRGEWQDGNWRTLAADLASTVARLWDDYVIGIDLDDQARGFLAMRDATGSWWQRTGDWLTALLAQKGSLLKGAGLLVLILMAGWGIWWLPALRRGDGGVTGVMPPFYARLLRWLKRRDLELRPGETPGELAARATCVLPAAAAVRVRKLTDLYYRVRYDGGDGRAAHRLMADLRRAFSRTA
ncbi:MAG: transglutaminaseTgpA domain-containing protein [Acidobacteria bacterium]|nr:transglutaminaseTgpA domain-containing protein [Acidobacteriota bacterium]